MKSTGPVDLALTWSQVKLAKEMARTRTISNQQASPNTLAKSTATCPKTMRYRNGFVKIGIWLPSTLEVLAMDKLLFWLGTGAAQKGSGSKEVKPSRHPVISFVVGILLALLIAAGLFILLVSQQ